MHVDNKKMACMFYTSVCNPSRHTSGYSFFFIVLGFVITGDAIFSLLFHRFPTIYLSIRNILTT